MTCKLKPNDKLRFDALRAAYSVGIGTLREALSHLVSDGLVRTEVGRGFRVAPVAISDLNDITAWRIDFEVRAITESIRRGDDAWEANIVSSFHLLSRLKLPEIDAPREDWIDYGKKHGNFHDALVASCGSPWLLYFRSVLFDQARRYQALAVQLNKSLVNRGDEDHRSIMDAVLDRDEEKAKELIESHIRRTTDVVLKDLDNSLAFSTNEFTGESSPTKKTARGKAAKK